MSGSVSQWAFYPTLFYNLVRNRLSSNWAWFNRIDETAILGALPFKSMIDQMINEEKVGGIVCLNEPHELQPSFVAQQADWEERGVQFYWLPVPDFVYAPHHIDIGHAVEFMRQFEGTGRCVYVHCKAGRTRSATIMACYLIQKHNWKPEEAVLEMSRHRPQVLLRTAHWNAITDFYKNLLQKSVTEEHEKEKNNTPPSTPV